MVEGDWCSERRAEFPDPFYCCHPLSPSKLGLIDVLVSEGTDTTLDPAGRGLDPLDPDDMEAVPDDESDDEEFMDEAPPELDFDTSILSRQKPATPRQKTQREAKVGTTQIQAQAGISKNNIIKLLIEDKREQRQFQERMLAQMEKSTAASQSIQSQPAKAARTQSLREPDNADETLWVRGNQNIEDNRVDRLDLKLRFELGAIQSAPKSWYKNIPKELAVVTQPRRGSTVYTEHLLGTHRLHPTLIWDLHDRQAYIDVSRCIKTNSGAIKTVDKSLVLAEGFGGEATSYQVKTNYHQPKCVFDLMEGLLAMQATVFQIRPYSHEISALLIALNTVRYFFSVAPDAAVQLSLVKTGCQAVLDENQQRAR